MSIVDPAARLYESDRSAEAFGIELVSADEHHAVVQMTVRPEMCNGFDIAHGGMTFLLADSAMAFASNAGGGRVLATSATVDWLAPVDVGTVLTARADCRWSGGRSAAWDIEVSAADGTVVGIVRGRTRRVT